MSSRLDPYELVGTTHGQYSFEAFVGFGRFSGVYHARAVDTHRGIAIRVLGVRTTLPSSERPVVLQHLRDSAASVEHVAKACPAFAGVLDVCAVVTPEGQWMPGVVQSLGGGEPRSTTMRTLQVVLAEERTAAPTRTLAATIEWMTPLAEALTHSHGCGLVHGSIAPQSIVVGGETTVRLLDLGMAAALASLQRKARAFRPSGDRPLFFFDPGFASPEHFASARTPDRLGTVSPASDVFSLALVTLTLLTGRAPLGEGNDAHLEAAALDPLVRPTPRARGRDLGGHVEAVFEQALAVRATDRFGTVESFWSALRAASRPSLHPTVVAPLPVPAPPSSSPTVAEAAVARARARRSIPPPSSSATPPATSERTLDVSGSARASSRATRPEDPASQADSLTPGGVVTTRRSGKERADDLVAGEAIAGKYSVERLLGRGGMGAVWLCTHVGLGERVAVKVMSLNMADNAEVRVRFEREGRASAKIKSRYVARVYDTGELPDHRPYIVMEYMEGETLADALAGGKAMTLADTARILAQVGRGLARAHELGIVHRDIKPQNIFLAHTTEDGVLAKVFDFGIVKVVDAQNVSTRAGVLVGTPNYMSPEQADGLPIDARSDIFSLGVMAFRMLTGKRLFHGSSIVQVLTRIITAPLPKLSEHAPSIPPAVDAWFQRACARNRENRFGNAVECVDALARAAGISFVSILPPPPPETPEPETPQPVAGCAVPSAGDAPAFPASSGPAPGDAESYALEDCDLLPVAEEDLALLERSDVGDPVARVTDARLDAVQRSLPPIAFNGEEPAPPRSGARAPARRFSFRATLALGGLLTIGGTCVAVFTHGLAPLPGGDQTARSAPAAAPPAPEPIPPTLSTPAETTGTADEEASVTSDAGPETPLDADP